MPDPDPPPHSENHTPQEPEEDSSGAAVAQEPGKGDTSLARALDLVRFLRAHCPWDAKQTPQTLIPYLLEEAHEVVDAIQAEDDAALEGELGDLLLNLAFQIVLGEERGAYDAESVTAALEEKMRQRHPQLYGLGEAAPWEELKSRNRGPESAGVLEGLAKGLDPLTKAHRMQERVSGVGFDWSDHQGAWDKVVEELEEVREALEAGAEAELEEELGDLLFAVVNLTRLTNLHPTLALERENRKFKARFEQLEALAAERGVSMPDAGLEALDELWEEVKRAERAVDAERQRARRDRHRHRHRRQAGERERRGVASEGAAHRHVASVDGDPPLAEFGRGKRRGRRDQHVEVLEYRGHDIAKPPSEPLGVVDPGGWNHGRRDPAVTCVWVEVAGARPNFVEVEACALGRRDQQRCRERPIGVRNVDAFVRAEYVGRATDGGEHLGKAAACEVAAGDGDPKPGNTVVERRFGRLGRPVGACRIVRVRPLQRIVCVRDFT